MWLRARYPRWVRSGAAPRCARAPPPSIHRRASAAEPPVDTEQDLVEVATDVVEARRDSDAREFDRPVIEKDVVPLDPERPIGSEHPLEPDTQIGTTGVPVHRGDRGIACGRDHRELVIDRAPSALDVEQECRREQIAEPCRDRRKPVALAVKRQGRINDADTVAFDVGPIDQALNAEYPVRGELIIAANLAASGESTTRKAAVVSVNAVVEVGRHLSPADVAADIAAGPQVDRSWRWQRSDRQVGCHR